MTNPSSASRIAHCAAALTALAALGDGFTYRTSWVGNTFGGADGVFVQMDARTLHTTPDGTCFLNVVWEEGGQQAGVYKNGEVLGNPGQTHGWGNSGGFAVAANDTYIFIAQRKDSEGGHLHEKDPGSYPPADVFWFGLTRRTRASNGKAPAPFAGGRGTGKTIRGQGDDKQAAMAGNWLVINEVHAGKGQNKNAPADAHIRGLALDNAAGRLYVSNPYTSEILVYDAETMARLASWPCPDTRQMVVAPDGTLWVVQARLDQWGRAGTNMPPAAILHFAKDGQPLPGRIESVPAPTGLAFDPNGRLLVADNGPDQQIRIFDVSGAAPVAAGTFGLKGGIYAGMRGQVAPLKFNGPQGVGCDAAGNLYVAGNGWGGNGSGLTLESYAPAGTRNWALYGLEFVDNGDFDRATDGNDIFTNYEHFRMDYGKASGPEWSYVGFTLDRHRFPDDPRLNVGLDTSVIRTLDGQRIMYATDMYASHLAIFRFEKGSEIAIPCGFFGKGGNKGRRFPPNDEELQAVRSIWVDRNDDGRPQREEFDTDNQVEPPLWAWWVDDRGDVWQGYQGRCEIVRFPLQGMTEQGAPIYTRASAVTEPAPAPFNRGHGTGIERVLYAPADDAMYLAGYTAQHPNPGGWWKHVGRVVARYENWTGRDGPRRLAWQLRPLSRDSGLADPPFEFAASFHEAGDLLFLIEGKSAIVAIHDKRTGARLATMAPGPDVGGPAMGQVGWIDVPYGMFAHRRKDGEYLVLAEEDYRAKNLLWRFRVPEEKAPEMVAGLEAEGAAGRVNLRWRAAPRAAAYLVERRDDKGESFSRIGETQSATVFADRTALAGRRYRYRVTAVGWGGAGPASGDVAASPTESAAGFEEDFEGGTSAIGGFTAVPMPEPKLPGGGAFAASLGTIARLPALPVPPGSARVVVTYDRLFAKPPHPGCREHFTRLFVSADGSRDRLGQEQTRAYLYPGGAGRWTPIRAEISLPEGTARLTGGELNNLIAGPEPGYDNPVYVDNLRVSFE